MTKKQDPFTSEQMYTSASAIKTSSSVLMNFSRITSDLAVEDYRQQGMSREVLLQNGYAILV